MSFDTDDTNWVWRRRLAGSREAYTALRSAYLKYIEHPNDIDSSVDPLADDENVSAASTAMLHITGHDS